MKASEVTKAMLDAFDENIDTSLDSEQKIIAAAVNAVFDDDAPITAEWLVANGWEFVANDCYYRYFHDADDLFSLRWNGESIAIITSDVRYLRTKTIGQLRALEIGLGLRS